MTISKDAYPDWRVIASMEVEAVGGKSLSERQHILNCRCAAGWDLITATDIFLYFRRMGQTQLD